MMTSDNSGLGLDDDDEEDCIEKFKWRIRDRSLSLINVLPDEEPEHIRNVLDVLVSPVTDRQSGRPPRRPPPPATRKWPPPPPSSAAADKWNFSLADDTPYSASPPRNSSNDGGRDDDIPGSPGVRREDTFGKVLGRKLSRRLHDEDIPGSPKRRTSFIFRDVLAKRSAEATELPKSGNRHRETDRGNENEDIVTSPGPRSQVAIFCNIRRASSSASMAVPEKRTEFSDETEDDIVSSPGGQTRYSFGSLRTECLADETDDILSSPQIPAYGPNFGNVRGYSDFGPGKRNIRDRTRRNDVVAVRRILELQDTGADASIIPQVARAGVSSQVGTTSPETSTPDRPCDEAETRDGGSKREIGDELEASFIGDDAGRSFGRVRRWGRPDGKSEATIPSEVVCKTTRDDARARLGETLKNKILPRILGNRSEDVSSRSDDEGNYSNDELEASFIGGDAGSPRRSFGRVRRWERPDGKAEATISSEVECKTESDRVREAETLLGISDDRPKMEDDGNDSNDELEVSFVRDDARSARGTSGDIRRPAPEEKTREDSRHFRRQIEDLSVDAADASFVRDDKSERSGEVYTVDEIEMYDDHIVRHRKEAVTETGGRTNGKVRAEKTKDRHFIYRLQEEYRCDLGVALGCEDVLRCARILEDADGVIPGSKRSRERQFGNRRVTFVPFSEMRDDAAELYGPENSTEDRWGKDAEDRRDDGNVFNDSFEDYDVQFTQIEKTGLSSYCESPERRAAGCSPSDLEVTTPIETGSSDELPADSPPFQGFERPERAETRGGGLLKNAIDRLRLAKVPEKANASPDKDFPGFSPPDRDTSRKLKWYAEEDSGGQFIVNGSNGERDVGKYTGECIDGTVGKVILDVQSESVEYLEDVREPVIFINDNRKNVSSGSFSDAATARKMTNAFENTEDIEINDGGQLKTAPSTSTLGFSTAGGKSVKISEKSLAFARNIMNEIENQEDVEINNKEHLKIVPSTSSSGFSTVGGKSVKISEKSLAFARNSMNEIENHEDLEINNKEHLKIVPCTSSSGFSTAGGESVKISEKSLAFARNMMNEIDKQKDIQTNDTEEPKTGPSMSTYGFSTAGGKSVNISEKSLAFARNMMNEIENKVDIKNTRTEEPKTGPSTSTCGFSTAGGKSVNISEKSLAAARRMMNEIETKEDIQINDMDESKTVLSTSTSCFSTAGGKSIKISEKSLAFARNVMNEIENQEGIQNNRTDEPNIAPSTSTPGLSTGGRRSVHVSEKSSAAARNQTSEIGEGEVLHIPGKREKSSENDRVPTGEFQKYSEPSESLKSGKGPKLTPSSRGGRESDSGYDLSRENPGNWVEKCDYSASSDRVRSGRSESPPFRGFPSPEESREASSEGVRAEVSESAAALLHDEMSTPDSDRWADPGSSTPYVTGPWQLVDRSSRFKPLLSCRLSPVDGPGKRKQRGPGTPTGRKKPRVEEAERAETLTAEQRRLVREKSCSEVKPKIGSHLSRRQHGQKIKLRLAVGGACPGSYTAQQLLNFGLKENVISVTSSNAVDFRFSAKDHFGDCPTSVEVSEGAKLIMDTEGYIGVLEIGRCLRAMPHVQPKLIPHGWIENHYRWIVWKLASMEKSFPQLFANRYLTPEYVVEQLKYRYDREIDRVERPLFRKILECDEPASRTFICCVSNIKQVDDGVELELTDGWYSIWAIVDVEMVSFVRTNLVRVGTKLVVYGAELLNCQQGTDPLQVESVVRLKVCSNSVRRARWDARLGYCRAVISTTRVSGVLAQGGLVGRLVATLARVYPPLYMSKDSAGKTVFRSCKAEEMEEAKSERLKCDRAESVYQEIWAQVEKEYKDRERRVTRRSRRDLSSITDPHLLYSIIEHAADPLTIESVLSGEQLNAVKRHRQEVFDRMLNEVQSRVNAKLAQIVPPRKVTNLLRVRLISNGCDKEDASAVLTVWRPTEELCSLLTESRTIRFINLVATGKRDGLLQLASTRQTQYELVQSARADSGLTEKFARCYSAISEIGGGHFVAPPFGEVDTMGLVVEVQQPQQPAGVTNVFLADPTDNDSLLAITFWTSLKVFGCEDVLKVGRGVWCTNLQWRSLSRQCSYCRLFAADVSTFSQNVPHHRPHLSQAFARLTKHIAHMDVPQYIKECKERLVDGERHNTQKRAANQSPAQVARSVRPPLNTISTCLGVETPVRKRIKTLEGYGRPPRLSPLVTAPTSRHQVNRDFKSPFRIATNTTKSPEY